MTLPTGYDLTVPTNGGKVTKLDLTFASSLSDSQTIFLICNLAELIEYPSDLLFGEDGLTCSY
jgi:hypothetical protein